MRRIKLRGKYFRLSTDSLAIIKKHRGRMTEAEFVDYCILLQEHSAEEASAIIAQRRGRGCREPLED